MLLSKQRPINEEQHGEDRCRRLCQDRDRCRENIEIIPAQMREGEVNRKRSDHAECRDHLRRCDDVIDGVGVRGMQSVPRRGGERDPAVRSMTALRSREGDE